MADGLPPRFKFLDPSNPINTGQITGTLSDIIKYHEQRANPAVGDEEHVGEFKDGSFIPKLTSEDITVLGEMDRKRGIDRSVMEVMEGTDPFKQIENSARDFFTPTSSPSLKTTPLAKVTAVAVTAVALNPVVA